MSKLDRPMPSVSLAGDTDGTEKMKGVYLNLVKEKQELKMGDFKLVATSSRKPGFSIDFGKSLEEAGKAKMSFGPPKH